MNASQVNADITAHLRARDTLLWIVSREEQRVERALVAACGDAKYVTRYWDCATGISDAAGAPIAREAQDPNAALGWLRSQRTRIVLVMRDLHKWLDATMLRAVRSLARDLQSAKPEEARAICVLTPSAEVPPELPDACVIEYPLPDRAEVTRILDSTLGQLKEEIRAGALADGDRDRAIDAAIGLTEMEISNCYAKSLVSTRRIDPTLVAGEKRRVIARERVLTWHDPDPRGLDAVGGLDALKAWLTARRAAFSPRARAFGLPAPKGMLLVGVPGTGKSLTAKAVATAWQMPLLRLDMGALRSKFVGDSEANIRKALKVAEAVSPCVLWCDEIDKALAGASGPAGDGGVAADALGTVLSWMQERQGSVFVVATANDVRGLPPELLRKGRFDELWWVDLPTQREREAIVVAAMLARGRGSEELDVRAVAAACEGFTGAEIDALVPDALFTAFADGERAVSTDDLTTAAKTVVPLAKTAGERLDALREWAKGRARYASTPEAATGGDRRTLDL